MNPASLDIANMIVAESAIGLTFAQDLFVGKEPATPASCVTIFDTPGFPAQLTLAGNREVGYYYPAIQIRVRNIGYIAGWTLINDIKQALHGRNNEVWGSMMYLKVKCVQEPFLLDWDENGHARFVVTFNIERTTT